MTFIAAHYAFEMCANQLTCNTVNTNTDHVTMEWLHTASDYGGGRQSLCQTTEQTLLLLPTIIHFL